MRAWAIGNAFGLLWAIVGFMALASSQRPWAAAVLMAIALLLIGRRWWRRSIHPFNSERTFRRRAYYSAVLAEFCAIALASWLLPRMGAGALFLNVVGVIVGLHFIGLAAASGQRRFLGISAAMCVISLVTMLVPSAGPPDWRTALLGIGNALALWIAANLSARTA